MIKIKSYKERIETDIVMGNIVSADGKQYRVIGVDIDAGTLEVMGKDRKEKEIPIKSAKLEKGKRYLESETK